MLQDLCNTKYSNNSCSICYCCISCSQSQPASLYTDICRVMAFPIAPAYLLVLCCYCVTCPQAQQSDAVVDGLQEVLDPMQPSAQQQLPVFMGGQSMGGMLTILTALRDQAAWQVHGFMPAFIHLHSLAFDQSLFHLQRYAISKQQFGGHNFVWT